MSASASEPPPKLPLGWTANWSKEAKRYFYWNSLSEQSLWTVPGEERAVQTQLPKGWSAHLADDKVHFYYFRAKDGTTQWEVPVQLTREEQMKKELSEMKARREAAEKKVADELARNKLIADRARRIAGADRKLAAHRAKLRAVTALSAWMAKPEDKEERTCSHSRHVAFHPEVTWHDVMETNEGRESWPLRLERKNWPVHWSKEEDDDDADGKKAAVELT